MLHHPVSINLLLIILYNVINDEINVIDRSFNIFTNSLSLSLSNQFTIQTFLNKNYSKKKKFLNLQILPYNKYSFLKHKSFFSPTTKPYCNSCNFAKGVDELKVKEILFFLTPNRKIDREFQIFHLQAVPTNYNYY